MSRENEKNARRGKDIKELHFLLNHKSSPRERFIICRRMWQNCHVKRVQTICEAIWTPLALFYCCADATGWIETILGQHTCIKVIKANNVLQHEIRCMISRKTTPFRYIHLYDS